MNVKELLKSRSPVTVSWIMTNISNYSSNFDESTSVHHIIQSIWLSFVFVLGTIGNLLVFSVILQKRRIINVANLFNLNLAVGDLTRIFVFIPVYLVYSSYDEWPLGLVGCKVISMIVQSSMTVSIVTLMFMSMERYQAVIKPLKKQVSEKLTLCVADDHFLQSDKGGGIDFPNPFGFRSYKKFLHLILTFMVA